MLCANYPLCLYILVSETGIIVLNSGKAHRTLLMTTKHSNTSFDLGDEDDGDVVPSPGDLLFFHGFIHLLLEMVS